ncbi:BREX-1 system adenine-specific DNA-methyltransferase PglX [Bacillus niameyensis]|uniref:BREX-1 system adenine-specific DNA-methyltransferase PglX n=1 Tax=Bacillus niameyensis TaxID=1522308 RepID=UPI000783F6A4|nr:BREX-1 system adenine-specific DNA-methyltransferase PglX [Bacillus niameyensis]
MDKSALKTFATSARRELLKKVEARAMKIGINEYSIKKAEIESSDAIFIDGKQLSKEERRQRNRLIERIKQTGYKQVMEEVAYAWFNRFTALRFMEVNDYLPTKVRVLSSSYSDHAEPDMMKEALSLDLELDKEYVYELKMDNHSEELFKYLIIKHCNDLNRYMPFMFAKIDDYSEILFPEGLLASDSFVRSMIVDVPESDWKQIEVIGWLYQFYIAEEKDRVFKEKGKYKPEEIPFATQLFTPDWIVRYMVQNALGRYWIEAHPEHRELRAEWEFYLEHEQEDFQEKIKPYVNKELNVEEIKCFDPAMGSGHILVYMFDVLYEIYSKCGYIEREIPRLIIEKNLYGLDIDDRAYQLACFSVVMKAMSYNRRFLRSIERDVLTLNLAAIQETNSWNDDDIAYIASESNGENFDFVRRFSEQYINAKTLGSLIRVTEKDTTFLTRRLEEIHSHNMDDLFTIEHREKALAFLPDLLKQTKIMGQPYDIVILNPPYMGSGSMNKELADFLRKNYPDSKADLFAAFMEIDHFVKENGFYAAINQHSWMFLSSFEKLREKIIEHQFIDTMLHLGPRAFEEIGGEVVQSTTFVLRNVQLFNGEGTYLRLINERTAAEKREKTIHAINNPDMPYLYRFNQSNFKQIPGSPIAYWVSDSFRNAFIHESIEDFASPKQGLITGDNDRFLKLWFEVDRTKFNTSQPNNRDFKWYPFNKGGSYRKWYGNREYVINWENDGFEIKNFKDEKGKLRSRPQNLSYNFQKAVSWSLISTGNFSVRYYDELFLFNVAGISCFPSPEKINYLLGFLNTNLAEKFTKFINPTLNMNVGDIANLPLIISNEDKERIDELVEQNIAISKIDWDSYETSWDYEKHPLLKFPTKKIEDSYRLWEQFTESQFQKLKSNEEELNQIFIRIYNLETELTPEVEEEKITIRKADLEREIKSFISYAIGCSFGRYSLDKRGLIYAGGDFNQAKYASFTVDQDNILPLLSGSYFEDDVVSRFIKFIKLAFSEENLNDNLAFIVDVLGQKKGETVKETLRRYFLNDFYKDHLKTYSKRPIYWLLTSGKEKAFNCLIYYHRYDKTTLSRIRTDYLHEYQIRLDSEKKDLLAVIEGDSAAKEISQAKRELKSLDKKIDELKAYDELLHHMADRQMELDLDDGIKLNYVKLASLVAKI